MSRLPGGTTSQQNVTDAEGSDAQMAPLSHATALDDAGRSGERIRDEIPLRQVQAGE